VVDGVLRVTVPQTGLDANAWSQIVDNPPVDVDVSVGSKSIAPDTDVDVEMRSENAVAILGGNRIIVWKRLRPGR